MQNFIAYILCALIGGAIGFFALNETLGDMWGALGAIIGFLGGIYMKLESEKKA